MRRLLDWLDKHNPAVAYEHSENVERCVLDLHREISQLSERVRILETTFAPFAHLHEYVAARLGELDDPIVADRPQPPPRGRG